MTLCQQVPLVNRPFFLPTYGEDLLKQLPYIEAAVANRKKQLLSLSKSERVEFCTINRFFFVLDANLSELEGTQTFEESEQALIDSQHNSSLPPAHQVTCNMRNAVEFLFGKPGNDVDACPSELAAANFTPSLARQLHSIVCDGLLQNAGCYRSRPARPANETTFYYAPPEDIPDRLDALFADCRAAIRPENSLLDTVQLAAKFLEQYLAIHPFSDGNGRTGRLLCALLLKPLLPEPVSICLASPQSREIFLHCLREARGRGGHIGLLTSYLLAAVDKAATDWIEWLYCCTAESDCSVVESCSTM